jgi:hypothetical protein
MARTVECSRCRGYVYQVSKPRYNRFGDLKPQKRYRCWRCEGTGSYTFADRPAYVPPARPSHSTSTISAEVGDLVYSKSLGRYYREGNTDGWHNSVPGWVSGPSGPNYVPGSYYYN